MSPEYELLCSDAEAAGETATVAAAGAPERVEVVAEAEAATADAAAALSFGIHTNCAGRGGAHELAFGSRATTAGDKTMGGSCSAPLRG